MYLNNVKLRKLSFIVYKYILYELHFYDLKRRIHVLFRVRSAVFFSFMYNRLNQYMIDSSVFLRILLFRFEELIRIQILNNVKLKLIQLFLKLKK